METGLFSLKGSMFLPLAVTVLVAWHIVHSAVAHRCPHSILLSTSISAETLMLSVFWCVGKGTSRPCWAWSLSECLSSMACLLISLVFPYLIVFTLSFVNTTLYFLFIHSPVLHLPLSLFFM